MIPMSARAIADITGGELVTGNPGSTACGVVIDSRAIGEGDCFVAIVGPRDDGHRYAQQTLAAGASVLVVQRPEIVERLVNAREAGIVLVPDSTAALQALGSHLRDTVDPLVVAITGSMGKTTTKTLTHALLSPSRPTHVTPGNFNNHWGLPLSLLGLEPHHAWMVAELGMSAPGEIAALAALARPQIAVITNVAPVHMENFDSVEGVAAAKRELADALEPTGTLVVSGDDPRTDAMADARRDRVARVIRFGLHGRCDVRAERLRGANGGWELDLVLPGNPSLAVRLPLPGEHSVANFLAAAAVAHALDIGGSDIAERAARLELPARRGQIHRTSGGITVIDDSYNASPAAMMRAIDMLASLPPAGRRILVLGDMLELGAWAEDAHREVGLHAAQLGMNLLFTVGPLARDIAHGAREGGLEPDDVRSFSTPGDAAAELLRSVRPGDQVLVKGSRGVRMEGVTQALLEADTMEETD